MRVAYLELHEELSCFLRLHMAESGEFVIPTTQQPALLAFGRAPPQKQDSARPFAHESIGAKRRPRRLQ